MGHQRKRPDASQDRGRGQGNKGGQGGNNRDRSHSRSNRMSGSVPRNPSQGNYH